MRLQGGLLHVGWPAESTSSRVCACNLSEGRCACNSQANIRHNPFFITPLFEAVAIRGQSQPWFCFQTNFV